MSPVAELPQAARIFVSFPPYVRGHGFSVSTEQTISFLTAIELLGPRSMEDIRRAAHAILAPAAERRAEFDALFQSFFMDQALLAPATSDGDEDELRVRQDDGGTFEPETADRENESGGQAAVAETLSHRHFVDLEQVDALRRFARLAPDGLPSRRGYRRNKNHRGDAFSIRQALRMAIRRDGEILDLPRTRRKLRHRKILLLIDVSGSMKDRTESHLRFAHALFHVSERVEVFTLGTRLTRVSRALRVRNGEQALHLTAGLVADWDGGTRLGDAIQAFLSLPRFAGFARGAMVIVLSDGLERGDHGVLTRAVARLSRIAWRISWLTPLSEDEGFQPQTAALQSLLPYIGNVFGGGSIARLCEHVLNLANGKIAMQSLH